MRVEGNYDIFTVLQIFLAERLSSGNASLPFSNLELPALGEFFTALIGGTIAAVLLPLIKKAVKPKQTDSEKKESYESLSPDRLE